MTEPCVCSGDATVRQITSTVYLFIIIITMYWLEWHCSEYTGVALYIVWEVLQEMVDTMSQAGSVVDKAQMV